MATLFSDPFVDLQFSNRQSKTLPYQVQADTQIHTVDECLSK